MSTDEQSATDHDDIDHPSTDADTKTFPRTVLPAMRTGPRGGGSYRSRALAGLVRWTVRPALKRIPVTPQRVRSLQAMTSVLGAGTQALPTAARVRTVALSHCHGEMVSAANIPESPYAILYAHGGGFVLGSSRLWRAHLLRLSAGTTFPVLSVDYRMAPDHQVSDGIDDCLTGYRWLIEVISTSS